MAGTVEQTQPGRATGQGQIAADHLPGDERVHPALRAAQGVLGGVGFVLAGFALPVAGIPAVALVLVRRRSQAAQRHPAAPGGARAARTREGSEGVRADAGNPAHPAVIPTPRRGGTERVQSTSSGVPATTRHGVRRGG